MANRKERAQIAQETVNILEKGFYTNVEGEVVQLTAIMQTCLEGTQAYEPNDFEEMTKQTKVLGFEPKDTIFELRNETTFAAAARLAAEGERPFCLNFASSKNPGGGFLSGSQAQEECLARASGLYPSLQSKFYVYEENRKWGDALYRDAMIYSPNVPVFRDDEDNLLKQPYIVDILTAPAPNAGAVRSKGKRNKIAKIRPTMQRRIAQVLDIALEQGNEVLVLGAWGCGVFRNEPQEVAEDFKKALETTHANRFKKVVFAVLDRTKNQYTWKAFERVWQYISI